MEEFKCITMLTKAGKTLYLSMDSGKPQWTFIKADACVWDTENEAENFAKKWFKKFKDYKIEDYIVNVDALR